MEPSVLGKVTVTFAVVLGSLALVTWRQSRTLEAYAELGELNRAAAVAEAERIQLERDIQVLTSRARVVPEARELGMHMPDVAEQVILPAGFGS